MDLNEPSYIKRDEKNNAEYESTQTKDKTKKRLFLGRWTWKEYIVAGSVVAALLALAGLLTVVIFNLGPILALHGFFVP